MYNNPYNRNYPQYYPQYQQYPQPTYQQLPVEQKFQDIKFLNAEQIKAYIVLPGTKEMLIDKENSMAYIVSADNMGNSTTKKYSFIDLNEPKEDTKTDMNEYVKITDLDKFVQKADLLTLLPLDSIKSLENKLQTLESRLNGEKDYPQTDSEA